MTPAEQIEAMSRVATQADLLAARLASTGSSSLSDAVRPSLPLTGPAPSSVPPVSTSSRNPPANETVIRSVYDPTVPAAAPRTTPPTDFDRSGATSGGGFQDFGADQPPPPPPATNDRPRSDEDPSRLPFALESTTQARLVEIRDALSTLTRVGGEGRGVLGQNLGDGRSDWERDVAKWRQSQEQANDSDAATRERMLYEAAPMGGSSRNLFDYGMRMRGIGSRLRSRLSRIRRQPDAPPDPRNYTANGRRKSSLDPTGTGEGSGFPSMADVIQINAATVNLTGPTSPASGTPAPTPMVPGPGSPRPSGKADSAAAGEVAGAVGGAEAGAAAGPVGMAAGMAIENMKEDPVGAALQSYPMVNTLATFATAVMDASKATYEFARAQEEEVRRLSEYGAGQAIGTANLDTGRILRDIDTAEQTGESAQGLTESIDKFETALQPIESLMTDVANTVSGRLLDLVTMIVDPVSELFKVFKVFYDGLPAWLKSGTSAPDYETSIAGLSAVAAETARINDPRWPR